MSLEKILESTGGRTLQIPEEAVAGITEALEERYAYWYEGIRDMGFDEAISDIRGETPILNVLKQLDPGKANHIARGLIHEITDYFHDEKDVEALHAVLEPFFTEDPFA